MNAEETYAMFAQQAFTALRNGSLSEERFVKFFTKASLLADAANSLGHCGSMDSARPAHANYCARCRVKRQLRDFEAARFENIE